MVHAKKSNNKFIGSCDMSAATDRLPLSLQKIILGFKFGNEYARAWGDLLTARYYMNTQGKHIYYSVGQPMGALSS